VTNTQEQLISTLSVDSVPLMASSESVSSESMVPEQSMDILATMHYTYAPLLKNSLPKLSKKELYRIVNTIIEIPPSEKTIKAFNQAQKNVYFTLEKVLMSKYFMMYNVALEKEMSNLALKQTEGTENNGSELAEPNNQSADTKS